MLEVVPRELVGARRVCWTFGEDGIERFNNALAASNASGVDSIGKTFCSTVAWEVADDSASEAGFDRLTLCFEVNEHLCLEVCSGEYFLFAGTPEFIEKLILFKSFDDSSTKSNFECLFFSTSDTYLLLGTHHARDALLMEAEVLGIQPR